MAEAVFRNMVQEKGLADRFVIASSGTGRWHVGEPPHIGTRLILSENKIEVGNKRAQQLKAEDFSTFDYIIAMDQVNLDDIQQDFKKEVKRLMDFAPQGYPHNVPDPYYEHNFEEVFNLVTAGSKGLLNYIIEKEGL
jgi:protein-tyrosine phosphatase